METIRTLTTEELDTGMRLSGFAFQMELSQEEFEYRKSKLRPETIWGYFVDDRMAAKLTILPLELWLQGRKLPIGGIAGVATWPEYRRQGLVGRLLGHSLRVMKERGQHVSCLHPFAFPFYRKYGWETYVEYKKYELESGQLPVLPEQPGRVERTNDLQVLGPLYESYAARYNGTLVRSDEWWQDRIFRTKQGTTAVYYSDSGEPAGYICYQVKNYEMTIHELVYRNEQAKSGLWKFIANHDSMVKKVLLSAPIDDSLPFWLPNPRIKQEVVPYFMARIVDVEAFVQRFTFAEASSPWELVLEVKDSFSPWNEGLWLLSAAEDGKAGMRRLESQAERPDLACDIQTLTTLLLGYKRPVQLAGLGRLNGAEEAVRLLEHRVPVAVTHLMDFF